jgi:hypothetical protein
MGELGLLGFLILALVVSMAILRRYGPTAGNAEG